MVKLALMQTSQDNWALAPGLSETHVVVIRFQSSFPAIGSGGLLPLEAIQVQGASARSNTCCVSKV